MNSTKRPVFESLNDQCTPEFREKRGTVSRAIADEEMVIGPAKLLPVQTGQKVTGSVSYFYTEDAPGITYDNFGVMVSEILLSIAAAGAGTLPLTEARLMQVANTNTSAGGDIFNFLATQPDTTTLDRPQGYLVYLAYDNQLNFVPSNSGALQVENPTTGRESVWTTTGESVHANAADLLSTPPVRNQLEQLLTQELTIQNDGFLHVEACPERGQGLCAEGVERVSNGSSDKEINFDNFLIKTAKGKARQINHYYPYGLRISGLNGISEDYKNMYTSKELQTGEFDQEVSSGLEMYDFIRACPLSAVLMRPLRLVHARFYDPQLGSPYGLRLRLRWFTPDPAEQFHNPYLAMGNNPVVYVDPDGEWVFIAAMAISGGYLGGSVANNTFNPGDWDWNSASTYVGIGIGAAVGGLGGAGISAGLKAGTISKTKLVSNLYTGGLNALYNYHPDQDVLTTLSYFASGYGAAAIGSFTAGGGAPLWEAKLASSMIGGMGNLAVAGMSGEISDGITTPLQAFTGGAVVGYSGTSLYAKKASQLPNAAENLKSKYLFSSNASLNKKGGIDKILTRGISKMVTNYAFTDPEAWRDMSGGARWGIPFVYGSLFGAIDGKVDYDNIGGEIRNRLITSGLRVGAYSLVFGAEYGSMTFSKGYYKTFKDAKDGKWKKKAGIVGWKSLFYGF